MRKTEDQLIIERYTEMKERRSTYISKWKDIQDYVAITNDIDADFENEQNNSKQKDIYINDPTAFLSVNQAGDYLAGILWNDGILTLEPSDYINKISIGEDLSDFYKKATDVTLEQVNSPDAGFDSFVKAHCYDQFSYGTSGLGAFRNKDFDNKQSECCLTFKPYGVWNSCIDEGSNAKVNIIFTVYNWRLNKIVDEFCYTDGTFDEKKLKNLPEEIQRSYENDDFNHKFKLVYGIMPNDHYKMYKRGKVGARYKGYWFLEGTKKIFQVDYYKELPVAIARAIRVNNQEYGESAGTLSLSTIKLLNFITGNAVDNIDKQTNTPLGIISGALINGNVLDTSANSVTQFNAKVLEGNKSPVFPIANIGDISALINFLIPKAEKDIVNTFKIDQLLDFNSSTQMTATESAYRMGIRGKAITGLIAQQKTEFLEPLMNRVISIIQDCNLYGHILEDMPETNEIEIALKQKAIEENNFIPETVVKAMRDGKKWYKIKFNGELEKIANSEKYESLGRFLQLGQAILQIAPELTKALNAYQFLVLVRDLSNLKNENLIVSEYKFKEILEQIQAQQAQQAQQQQLLLQSQAAVNAARADKDGAEAYATQQQSD